MSLVDVINAIQGKVRAIPGIKEAPATITESAALFPFGITYPRTGTVDAISEGLGRGLHTIFVEIHMSRVLLGDSVIAVLGYMALLENALRLDPTVGGTVSTINFPLRYTFGRLEWGSVPTVGVRYEVTVKINDTIV